MGDVDEKLYPHRNAGIQIKFSLKKPPVKTTIRQSVANSGIIQRLYSIFRERLRL